MKIAGHWVPSMMTSSLNSIMISVNHLYDRVSYQSPKILRKEVDHALRKNGLV